MALLSFALGGALHAEAPQPEGKGTAQEQRWNFHFQNTDIIQGDLNVPARYSGPNSLSTRGETNETVSLDLSLGLRLWRGAEVHVDGLMWQGFGLSGTRGAAGFPNGEAFRVGVNTPNFNIPRAFIRQVIGFGGPQEDVADDALHLAGKQDVSRLTLTLGKMSAKDIFDNNAYANDARTQFMNWSLMANGAWDYPGDALGFITGFAAELNQPTWALRYGFFQVPKVSNGVAIDGHFLDAWSMVAEFEHRHTLAGHPGVVRVLAAWERAHMGSYSEAAGGPVRPADITATRAYRNKVGFGLNIEQEITKDIGLFSRLGWSDGKTEAWVFTDVDRTASLGLRIKGRAWERPDDIVGIAGVWNGISGAHRRFLAVGGTGILVGDGTLTYGGEKILETYYDIALRKGIHLAFDYQFISSPAFNRDRGPVSVFGGRLHWEF
jgi:high affinity Mn2+ porin